MGRRARPVGAAGCVARSAAEKTRRAYLADVDAARRVGGRAGARARGPRPQAPAPVRRRPVRARRVEVDGRAQAGVDPVLLPPPRRPRRARGEPGRPRREPEARPVPAARAEGGRGRLRCSTRSRHRRRSSCATARCSSSPTPPGCARRSSSNLDVTDADSDAEELRVHGKGGEEARRPGRRAGLARARRLPRARAARCWHARATQRPSPRSSSRRAAGGSAPPDVRRRLTGLDAARRDRRGRRRTRCGTRSRPTCWRAVRICARSRSCSATRPSARPRHTLG